MGIAVYRMWRGLDKLLLQLVNWKRNWQIKKKQCHFVIFWNHMLEYFFSFFETFKDFSKYWRPGNTWGGSVFFFFWFFVFHVFDWLKLLQPGDLCDLVVSYSRFVWILIHSNLIRWTEEFSKFYKHLTLNFPLLLKEKTIK